VEDGLRPVLGLDDDVRFREGAVHVTSLIAARLLEQLSAADRLVRVEQRFADLPLDVDLRHGRAGLGERVCGDGRDGHALVAGLVDEHVRVARADGRPHARRVEGPGEIDSVHARARVR
jgi:hypothetical protein